MAYTTEWYQRNKESILKAQKAYRNRQRQKFNNSFIKWKSKLTEAELDKLLMSKFDEVYIQKVKNQKESNRRYMERYNTDPEFRAQAKERLKAWRIKQEINKSN